MKNVTNKLILILGIALILAGSFLFYNGFGIIEAQRGWAQVISGASLIAGGAVVLALSCVLTRLDSLAGSQINLALNAMQEGARPAAHLSQAHLENEVFHGLSPATKITDTAHLTPIPATSNDGSIVDPMKSVEKPMAMAATGLGLGAAALGLGGAALVFTQKTAGAASVAMPIVHNLEMPAAKMHATDAMVEPQEDAVLHEHEDEDIEAAATDAVVTDPVSHTQDETPRDDEIRSAVIAPAIIAPALVAAVAPAPLPAWHSSAPVSVPTPPSLELDEHWLDDAFSGKSAVHADTVPPPANAQPNLAGAAHQEGTLHDEASTEAPPHVADPPIVQYDAVNISEPVVERFSAGGIQYVLFQNGSIDADDGVHVRHFSSMDHLKEYMEGQGRS